MYPAVALVACVGLDHVQGAARFRDGVLLQGIARRSANHIAGGSVETGAVARAGELVDALVVTDGAAFVSANGAVGEVGAGRRLKGEARVTCTIGEGE